MPLSRRLYLQERKLFAGCRVFRAGGDGRRRRAVIWAVIQAKARCGGISSRQATGCKDRRRERTLVLLHFTLITLGSRAAWDFAESVCRVRLRRTAERIRKSQMKTFAVVLELGLVCAAGAAQGVNCNMQGY